MLWYRPKSHLAFGKSRLRGLERALTTADIILTRGMNNGTSPAEHQESFNGSPFVAHSTLTVTESRETFGLVHRGHSPCTGHHRTTHLLISKRGIPRTSPGASFRTGSEVASAVSGRLSFRAGMGEQKSGTRGPTYQMENQGEGQSIAIQISCRSMGFCRVHSRLRRCSAVGGLVVLLYGAGVNRKKYLDFV